MTLRALFVHAHPDDESITTGGTLAAFAARGIECRVVTCTLGEEGEVLDPKWEGLVADAGDQLGGYRIGELTRALAELGVGEPSFLGGMGRWRDSGMAGSPSQTHPRAFVRSGDEAVAELAAVIDGWRPDLVVTYDADGGYGHPDHIRAHDAVDEAIAACSFPPRRLAWTVTASDDLTSRHPSPPEHTRNALAGELPGTPAAAITHVVALDDDAHARKLRALGAHETQLGVYRSAGGAWFALTNGVLQPVPRREAYVAFDRDADGRWARCPHGTGDLAAGLEPSDGGER